MNIAGQDHDICIGGWQLSDAEFKMEVAQNV